MIRIHRRRRLLTSLNLGSRTPLIGISLLRISFKLRATRAKGICLQGPVNEGMIIIQKEKSIVHHSCLGNGCGGRWLHPLDSAVHRDLPVRLGRCALPRDMACLTALVAHFTGRVQGSAVRSCAIARNMALYALNPGPSKYIPMSDLPACRMHSISWLVPGSHERSGLVHHTCSMLQGEDHQRLPQSPRENRRQILHGEEQLPDLQQMQVRVESPHSGKIAVVYRQRERPNTRCRRSYR